MYKPSYNAVHVLT